MQPDRRSSQNDSGPRASSGEAPADFDSIGAELEESEWRFRALFEMGPIGVAYHEMIYDEAGEPVDYRFIDANQRYIELTGVDPRGRTVTAAFPGIKSDPFDWIATFGKVARGGKSIRFEQCLELNERWYDVVAYQYKPDHFVAAFLEVTERKHAEEELRRSQMLLASSLESQCDTVMFSIDRDYRYLYFNQAHASVMLAAYGVRIAPGMNILECISTDDDRMAAKENYDRALAGESHSNIRMYGDLERAYYESFFNPMRDTSGQILGATGLARNITERMLEQEARRESEELHKAILRTASDGYWMVDLEGRLLEVNDAYCRMSGYSEDELLTMRIHDLDCLEMAGEMIEHIKVVVSKGSDIFQSRHRRKDGSEFDVEISAQYQPGREGRLVVFARDIDELNRTLRALRESEDKFKYLFEHSMVAKSLTRPSGEINVNQAFCDLIGYSLEELSNGTKWQQISHPDDVPETQRIVASLIANEIPSARFTKRYIHKDGHVIWGDVSTSLRRAADGTPEYFMTSIIDVTERVNAQQEILDLNDSLGLRVAERTEELTSTNVELALVNEELLDANIQLEEATRAKSAFLAAMSHELRTPLNSIIGFSGILEQGMPGALNAEQQRQVRMIHRSGQHLLELINDVLDLAKIESGRSRPIITDVDLCAVLRAMFETVGPMAEMKHIGMTLMCPQTCTGFRTDPHFVSQILLNLLGNAIKFTDDGGVTTSMECDRGDAVIRVQDTGCGIEPTDLDHIFEDFFQATSRDGIRHEGTGLGLAVSLRLAEALGGSIEVESEPGIGSTFTLTLPGDQSPT